MKANKKEIFIWELIGILFLVLVGSALHFTYELSGENFIVGFFSAINESTWEHLKLGYFAIIFYTIIEYISINKQCNNFFTAKAVSSIFLSLFIVLMSIGAKTILGKNIVFVDISIFVVGCLLAQILSYKILTLNKNCIFINLISLLFLFITTFIFFGFTLNPPNHWLFDVPKVSTSL